MQIDVIYSIGATDAFIRIPANSDGISQVKLDFTTPAAFQLRDHQDYVHMINRVSGRILIVRSGRNSTQARREHANPRKRSSEP